MRYLRTPKVQIAVLLTLTSFYAVFNYFTFELVFRFIFIILFTLGAEYFFWRVRGISPFVLSASIVTALIIFLLFDNISPVYYAMIPISLAIVQKQFLRIGGKHIFNPAVFGLFISSLIGFPTFWWGTNLELFPLLLFIAGGLYVTSFNLKQHFIIIPYILTSLIIYISNSGFGLDLKYFLYTFLTGSFVFFTLVMLPEPMTAPSDKLKKVLFGAFVAALPLLLVNKVPGDILLFSLLFGNLGSYLLDKS